MEFYGFIEVKQLEWTSEVRDSLEGLSLLQGVPERMLSVQTFDSLGTPSRL